MASGTHISGPIKGQAAVLTLAAGDIVPFHPWPFAGATCTKVDTKTDVDGLLSCGVFQCQIYPKQLRPLWLRGELKKVRSSGAAQSLPKRMISRQPSVASSLAGDHVGTAENVHIYVFAHEFWNCFWTRTQVIHSHTRFCAFQIFKSLSIIFILLLSLLRSLQYYCSYYV